MKNKRNTNPPAPTKIRGTIASGTTALALVVATMAFLAERGNSTGVQLIAKDIGNGNIGDAFDKAQTEVTRTLFNGVDNPVDLDGKPLYVGMHPFKGTAFGVYRTELRTQHATKDARAVAVTTRREEREARVAAAKAAKRAKAETLAANALAKANKARARAEQVAKKYGINLKAVSAESAASKEADKALSEINSRPSNMESPATA